MAPHMFKLTITAPRQTFENWLRGLRFFIDLQDSLGMRQKYQCMSLAQYLEEVLFDRTKDEENFLEFPED